MKKVKILKGLKLKKKYKLRRTKMNKKLTKTKIEKIWIYKKLKLEK